MACGIEQSAYQTYRAYLTDVTDLTDLTYWAHPTFRS